MLKQLRLQDNILTILSHKSLPKLFLDSKPVSSWPSPFQAARLELLCIRSHHHDGKFSMYIEMEVNAKLVPQIKILM